MAREESLVKHQQGRNRLVAYVEHTREILSRSSESGAIFGFLSVLIFFVIATAVDTGWPPQILDLRSIASIATNATSQGIIAVGVTMLMISGEFDLSVGSMLGLSALMFILAANSGPGSLLELIPGLSRSRIESWGVSYAGMNGVASILVALATGAFLGWINGVLLVWTRIPSFIVTLGTLYIYRSMMLNIIPGGTIARYTRAPIVWSFDPWVIIIGTAIIGLGLLAILWPTIRHSYGRLQEARQKGTSLFGPLYQLIVNSFFAGATIVVAALVIIGYSDNIGHPVKAPFFDILNGKLDFVTENFRSSIVWWLLLAGLFTIVLNHTRYGNSTFATGGNPAAARAQGVNVNRIKVLNFVLSGMMAATAGIMEAARFKVVEPLRGTGYELDVIAATVIGGTLLTGGYGSIIGSVLGILIAFMLKTGLVLIGIQADWFRGVLGIIMIGAVIVNTNIRRQR